MLTKCLGRENLQLFLGARQKVFADPLARLPTLKSWRFDGVP